MEKMKENGKNNNKKETVQKLAFYKLFMFADKVDVVLMVVGTFCAIATGVANPCTSLIFGQLVNTLSTPDIKHVVELVAKASLDYVYLAIGAGIASFIHMSCWMATGERQAERIRGLYLNTILRQDIEFFDTETSTGEVIGRMSGDTLLIQEAIGEKVGKFIQFISSVVGGFAIALIRGWQLAIVLAVSMPAMLFTGWIMAMIMGKMSSRGQIANAAASNVVDQIIGAIRTVASFTGEKQAKDKYNTKLQIANAATVGQGIVSGFGVGTFMCIVFLTYSLAIWYGSKMIIEQGYNGGKVMNVIFAIIIGATTLNQTSPCMNAFSAGQAAAYKMFETIKRKPKIDVYDTSGIVLENIEGEIEFKDVNFRYPARPDVQIFSEFSLLVPSGSTTALVGQSGSGKSTVISLLERYYDPDSGVVLIDGVDITKLQLKWLRQNIGLVGQEPILFTTTIKENITYGKENASDEEIRRAIELANAARFIDKLPEGLDVMVGCNGTQLSGGQKQRIAIARAILKNPKILLLDEATSSLDAESERIVSDALENVMTNRTTVVVAHRLTTVRKADIIAVLDKGKLVEQGSHDELIKNPMGAYSQLVHLQEGAKEAGKAQVTGVDKSNASSSQMDEEMARPLRGSSSGHHSFGFDDGVASFSIYKTQDEEAVEEKSETSEIEIEKAKKVSIKRLAYLNKPEIPVLLIGAFAAVIDGVILPIFALILSIAIKMFFKPPHQLRKESKMWSVVFMCLSFISLIATPLKSYFFGMAGGKLILRIRSLTFEKIIHQQISWFDDPANSSGAIVTRLSTDALAIKSLVGDILALIVQNIATMTSGLVIAFTANWMLALIILAISPMMLIDAFIQAKFQAGFSADAKALYEEASQVANEAIGGMRTVASFCAEKKVMDLYQKKSEAPMKQGVRLALVSGVGFGFSFFLQYCVNAFCFYIGSIFVQHEKASMSDIFRVMFAFSLSAISISQATAMAPDTNKAKVSLASILEILDSKPKIDSSSNEGTTLSNVDGDIEFERVSFKYPNRPNVPILEGLCLNIPSGKTVALVGESGSGKSTVINLLERFYNPDSGRIFLDHVEIYKLKLSWLRQQMGLVGQEPILFNETIRANIAYGKQGQASEEEIIAATKAANAHNFISALPQGYDTNVGERGTQLSGGQKQRVAIARAIIKNPRILLLDEATSALDTESERVVQEALETVMVNRTALVVAHRLATIKNADIIAVVKNGVISEKGGHDTLMKINNGAYASLVALHVSSS